MLSLYVVIWDLAGGTENTNYIFFCLFLLPFLLFCLPDYGTKPSQHGCPSSLLLAVIHHSVGLPANAGLSRFLNIQYVFSFSENTEGHIFLSNVTFGCHQVQLFILLYYIFSKGGYEKTKIIL